tara:strand:- start:453 stop:1013 length:561 start_codon:yes stop_codon:yes gene_type:complete
MSMPLELEDLVDRPEETVPRVLHFLTGTGEWGEEEEEEEKEKEKKKEEGRKASYSGSNANSLARYDGWGAEAALEFARLQSEARQRKLDSFTRVEGEGAGEQVDMPALRSRLRRVLEEDEILGPILRAVRDSLDLHARAFARRWEEEEEKEKEYGEEREHEHGTGGDMYSYSSARGGGEHSLAALG